MQQNTKTRSIITYYKFNQTNMKGKFYLVVAIVAVSVCTMVACGSKDAGKDKEKDGTGQVAAGGGEVASKAKEEVMAMVKAIYDDVDIIYSTGSEPDVEAPIDLMSKYGSKKFYGLVEQVRKIDADKDEENRFVADWDGLLCYWDVGVCQPTDITVTIDGSTAKVNYELYYSGQYATYVLALVNEEGQWRIDDILQICNDVGSKVEQMTNYLKENS